MLFLSYFCYSITLLLYSHENAKSRSRNELFILCHHHSLKYEFIGISLHTVITIIVEERGARVLR
jgi:hypothetical protein